MFFCNFIFAFGAISAASGLILGKRQSPPALVGANPSNDKNINLRNPSSPIYPKKSEQDGTFELPEQKLRQAIYIPPSFTFGKKTPIILVPGTGNNGYQTFGQNWIPHLQNAAYADPIWMNIPNSMLSDAQLSGECIAYAINYISGITNSTSLSVLSWSQGGMDVQWALKFWPSARKAVARFAAVSPDFHGSTMASLLCGNGNGILSGAFDRCAPSVRQQDYNSKFIAALRANGGGAALIPTTVVYTGYDAFVNPQSGTNASAALLNTHGAGVTNNQIEVACAAYDPGHRGASSSSLSHSNALVNGFTYHIVVDSLTNGGPGQVSRLDMTNACKQSTWQGFAKVGSETAMYAAAVNILGTSDKTLKEPEIREYARNE